MAVAGGLDVAGVDPGNLLLTQSENEVLSQELEIGRLGRTLESMRAKQVVFAPLRHPSPLSLPLMVERFRERLTTEQLSERLDRILRDMERDAMAGLPQADETSSPRPTGAPGRPRRR